MYLSYIMCSYLGPVSWQKVPDSLVWLETIKKHRGANNAEKKIQAERKLYHKTVFCVKYVPSNPKKQWDKRPVWPLLNIKNFHCFISKRNHIPTFLFSIGSQDQGLRCPLHSYTIYDAKVRATRSNCASFSSFKSFSDLACPSGIWLIPHN